MITPGSASRLSEEGERNAVQWSVTSDVEGMPISHIEFEFSMDYFIALLYL